MTLSDALSALERLYRLDDRASLATMPYQIARLVRRLGERELERITEEDVLGYVERRLEEGAARSTVNRETGYLRRALKLARDRGRVTTLPRIPHLRVDNARSGYLLPEEYRRLVATLEVLDLAVSDLVRSLYLLGWRTGELRALRWEEVEEDRITLPARRSKNGVIRAVALSGELLDVIRRRRAAQHGPHVFHRGGRPVKCFRRTWRRAVRALGRPELTPHDLRRSFARNALQAGVPQSVIMAIGGWKTTAMFRRYAIIDERQVAEALERVQSFCSGSGEAHVWAPANSSRKKSAEGG